MYTASKTGISKTYTTKKKNFNSTTDYTSVRYLDIQKKWIICEGNLNYRYDYIKFVNISRGTLRIIVYRRYAII